jgi:hypothetical protein
MKHVPALVCACVLALTPFALADQGDSSATPTPTPSTSCTHRCQFERDRAKLRKQTSRQPIPSYITDCESGGSYRAYNSSSGAGGKYQALPSTWRVNLPRRRIIRLAEGLFTPRQERRQIRRWGALDKGPRWSSPLLQDIVADNIWDSQGIDAWSCA